jgi:hypothetical protein
LVDKPVKTESFILPLWISRSLIIIDSKADFDGIQAANSSEWHVGDWWPREMSPPYDQTGKWVE